jgi:hypothetical protein
VLALPETKDAPDVAVGRAVTDDDEEEAIDMVDFAPLQEVSNVGGCFRATSPKDAAAAGAAERGLGGGEVLEIAAVPNGASIR